MRVLKPIRDRESYYDIIEELIKQKFYYEVYKPIIDIASSDRPTAFENSRGALIKAIRSGKIAYVEGFFVGEFNSAIGLEMRKMGAQFNHVRQAYAIPRDKLPLDVKTAINEGTALIKYRVDAIYKKLSDLQSTNDKKSINFDFQFSGILIDLDKQFTTTLSKDISVPMVMTPYVRENIKKNYSENLNLYINEWYDTAILRLRQKVHKNVEEGFRASHLIPIIQAEKNVSYNKAKFLARQETSLLVSQYRQERYTEVGLKRYKWLTSGDSRVRPNAEARKTGHTENNHRILNGHIYEWSNPPVVDSATGRRCHPGQDYGCRCVAAPIVE